MGQIHKTGSLKLGALAIAALLAAFHPVHAQQVTGGGAPYEAVTLAVAGPTLDERGEVNPFADVRLDWIISNGSERWTVPGYFAGCAMAADNGCTQGNAWRAHFVPEMPGTYSWRIVFQTGRDIAISAATGKGLSGNGEKGQFVVAGQSADPVRARGMLQYTGDRYYRFSGDGSVFFKFGPDAPENMLAYSGFDATPDTKGLRKDWRLHERDLQPAGAAYTWGDTAKGAGLLGMFDYLVGAGANSVSMLLWNAGGDDRNVFPHLLTMPQNEYAALQPAAQWSKGLVQDRFDISKLDQWQRALSYADKLGLHLHFKLQETENDRFMDGGTLGRTRRLYVREMVARFGHFLALTWNLGEENVQSRGDLRHMASYLAGIDVHDHPLAVHTYPEQKELYRPLLGPGSAIDGLSMQGALDDYSDLRGDIVNWSAWAQLAGKPVVISYDEPGTARGGAGVDPDYPAAALPSAREVQIDPEVFLRDGLWNSLTAGGMGVEAYYGYKTGCTDLDCQDHRTRARLWREGRHALDFFRQYLGEKVLTMQAVDTATRRTDDYVFADIGEIYVIVPGAEPVTLQTLGAQGRFSVHWFDRALGGKLQSGSVTEVAFGERNLAIGEPPEGGSGKWVALVRAFPDEGILVEAEDFVAQRSDQLRSWCRAKDCPPGWERSGAEDYIIITPDTRITHDDKLIHLENFTEEGGKMAVLSYDVDFPAAGRWYLWVRSHSLGTEDNGVHFGLNGGWPQSAARVQFCEGKGRWYWDNRRRTQENHCGVEGGLWLDVPEAGRHRVEVSMREDGFSMDAFYLTRSALMPSYLRRANSDTEMK